eukprot:GHVR01091370.1.p1 GENE.GHVR01091370.1~~GHVR01091370.1.p1  ORF type:complete len:253 (+),score=63.49 GHVR01091370.1:143-901(+)
MSELRRTEEMIEAALTLSEKRVDNTAKYSVKALTMRIIYWELRVDLFVRLYAEKKKESFDTHTHSTLTLSDILQSFQDTRVSFLLEYVPSFLHVRLWHCLVREFAHVWLWVITQMGRAGKRIIDFSTSISVGAIEDDCLDISMLLKDLSSLRRFSSQVLSSSDEKDKVINVCVAVTHTQKTILKRKKPNTSTHTQKNVDEETSDETRLLFVLTPSLESIEVELFGHISDIIFSLGENPTALQVEADLLNDFH